MRLSERLPQETDRGYALRTIKEAIIDLELAPGSQISENELAAALGLSRTPVREALMELAKVKIVKVVPQKRSTVALIDYSLVEEARFMRTVLELAVVELDCRLAAPEGLRRLEENVRLQKFYMAGGDAEKVMALDDDFHALLFHMARKSLVYDITRNMQVHFDRVRRMALDSVKDIRIVEDHERILDAVRAGDTETAQALMRVHLTRYRYDARAIREAYPQYMAE